MVNGLPLTDNRSPAFAPEIEADDVQSMNILTADYPAEYGRKLGGVIEVTTARERARAFTGRYPASGGSFDTAGGYAHGAIRVGAEYPERQRRRGASPTGTWIRRCEQNYTNRGTTGSFAAHYETRHQR